MTKLSIKSIKHKIINLKQPLSTLEIEELFAYFTYRLDNLIVSRNLLTKTEMLYLLCETGNGRLRFDPEIVELLINSEKLKSRTTSVEVIGNEVFAYRQVASKEQIKGPAKEKAKLVNLIAKSQSKYAVRDEFIELIRNNKLLSKVGKMSISADKEKLEFLLPDKSLIVWCYLDKWIYPYSSEVWQLVIRAKNLSLSPILLSRKIHGVCFPLFKAVGLFGGNTYSLYLPNNVIDDINKFNSTTWALPTVFSPGQISLVADDVHIENFFEKNLKNHGGLKLAELRDDILNKIASNIATEERIQALILLIQGISNRSVRMNLTSWIEKRLALLQGLAAS